MKANEILRKIYLYEELPGHALIADSYFIEREKEAHFASFFYTGKEFKKNTAYLVVHFSRYFSTLRHIFGEVFAEYGYDNERFYVWEIEE